MYTIKSTYLAKKINLNLQLIIEELKEIEKDVNLKTAINIAYYNTYRDINISDITKQIAFRHNISHSDSTQSAMGKTVGNVYIKGVKDSNLKKLFPADYKITTKDFINRALYYIDNT